jgi:arginyl-tRNA synthetase
VNRYIRDSVANVVKSALEDMQASGDISLESLPEIKVEATKDVKFGDVTTNIALLLAGPAKKPAREIGQYLVASLQKKAASSSGAFRSVELAGPGFINFSLGRETLSGLLSEILNESGRYGCSKLGQNKKVMIEFVSANPTGPLTLAHGRQAAVGDSLARIMNYCGYRAHKEYYLNDRGRQMNTLGHSVYLRYLEHFGKKIDFPEDFYQGPYIRDLAEEVVKSHQDQFLKTTEEEAIAFFSKYAGDTIMGGIRKDLSDFDVAFDEYFSEKEFVSTGEVEISLEELKKNGFAYEQDGALWLKSTDFGDDKDRVLIKSSGEMTYISPDLAYHRNKYRRGYDGIVNIWGPDHHGYIPRLKAAMQALKLDPSRIHVIILQLATLFEGDKKIHMSTRRGEFVTLRQVIDEVGRNVGRFFFLMRKTDSHLDFDLELAKKQSLENPVYYIQYAHARICSIFEKFSQEKGEGEITAADLKSIESFEPEEVELIKRLGLFQEVLEFCCQQFDPYPLTDYLLKTAQAFHAFYTKHRIIGEDLKKARARLALAKSVQIVLKNGLGLLGIDAPQSM